MDTPTQLKREQYLRTQATRVEVSPSKLTVHGERVFNEDGSSAMIIVIKGPSGGDADFYVEVPFVLIDRFVASVREVERKLRDELRDCHI